MCAHDQYINQAENTPREWSEGGVGKILDVEKGQERGYIYKKFKILNELKF